MARANVDGRSHSCCVVLPLVGLRIGLGYGSTLGSSSVLFSLCSRGTGTPVLVALGWSGDGSGGELGSEKDSHDQLSLVTASSYLGTRWPPVSPPSLFPPSRSRSLL